MTFDFYACLMLSGLPDQDINIHFAKTGQADFAGGQRL